MNKVDYETVCRELRTHKTNKQIAKELHVHHTTVCVWRKLYGVRRFISKEECHARILSMLIDDKNGIFQSEMVNACGCSRQKIYWILRYLENRKLVYAVGKTNNRKWYLNRK